MGDLFRKIVNVALLRPAAKSYLGKDWWQSLTVWGVGLYVAAQAIADALCAPGMGLLPGDWCPQIASVLDTVGKVLVALGLRRAATRRD